MAQVLKLWHHQGRVAHQGVLGDFQRRRSRRQPRLGKARLEIADEVGLVQLPRRGVHGHPASAVAGGAPCGHLRERRLLHQRVDAADEAGLLGKGQELVGFHQAAVTPAPTGEGLHAHDGPTGEINLWLVMHLDLARVQRLAQGALHAEAGGEPLVHFRAEQTTRIAALALGVIHGDVRVADERAGGGARLGVERHAGAGRGGQPRVVHGKRFAQRAHQLLADGDGGIAALHLRQHEGEFVAAEARQRVAAAQAAPQASRHGLQHPVADGVAMLVVHQLEAVQIQERDGQAALVALGLGDGEAQAVLEDRPVRQAREHVVVSGEVRRAADLTQTQDVARQDDGADECLLAVQPRQRDHRPQPRGLFRAWPGAARMALEPQPGVAHRRPGTLAIEELPRRFKVFGIDEHGAGLAQQRVWLVAQEPHRRAVDKADDAVPVEEQAQVRRAFHEASIERVIAHRDALAGVGEHSRQRLEMGPFAAIRSGVAHGFGGWPPQAPPSGQATCQRLNFPVPISKRSITRERAERAKAWRRRPSRSAAFNSAGVARLTLIASPPPGVGAATCSTPSAKKWWQRCG